jgi:hypothetical protein
MGQRGVKVKGREGKRNKRKKSGKKILGKSCKSLVSRYVGIVFVETRKVRREKSMRFARRKRSVS